jgi:hypothetical protein
MMMMDGNVQAGKREVRGGGEEEFREERRMRCKVKVWHESSATKRPSSEAAAKGTIVPASGCVVKRMTVK